MKSPALFRIVPSTIPMASLSQDWGFATPTLNFNLRNVHQVSPIHSQGPSEQKPVKIFGEKGTWAYPGTAEIFYVHSTPYYLWNW